MNEHIKLLVQLIISLFLILCAYLLPTFAAYSEYIAIISAILLTVGIILLVGTIKAFAKYYLKKQKRLGEE